MKMTLKSFVLAVLMAAGFSSCTDEPNSVIPNEKNIAGIWQWIRWEGTEEGSHFVEDYEKEEKYQTKYLSRDIYIFESDGTFIDGSIEPGKSLNVKYKGTWSLIEGAEPMITVTKKNIYLPRAETITMQHRIIDLTNNKIVISYVDGYYNTEVTMKRLNSVKGYPENQN